MAPIVAPVDRAGTGALTVEILDSVSSSECSFPYAGSRQTALPSEGTAARGASILFAIHRSRPAAGRFEFRCERHTSSMIRTLVERCG